MCQGTKQSSQRLVKPNCTITLRHNKILDRMASDYYVSRSEALRACITDHERTLDGDSEDSIKLLHEKVDSQSKQLDDLSNSIESLLTVIVRPQIRKNSLGHGSESFETSLTTIQPKDRAAAQKSKADQDIILDEEIYDSISKLKGATISEISDYCGRTDLEVIDSIERLDSHGLVSPSTQGDVTQFQVRIESPNRKKAFEVTDDQ